MLVYTITSLFYVIWLLSDILANITCPPPVAIPLPVGYSWMLPLIMLVCVVPTSVQTEDTYLS